MIRDRFFRLRSVFMEKLDRAVAGVVSRNHRVFIALALLTLAMKAVYLAFYSYHNLGDDWYYIEAARKLLDGGVLYRNFGDSHPPFNYLIFYLLLKYAIHGNILITIKISYVALTILSCWFIFLIFSEMASRRAAFTASAAYLALICAQYDLWEFNICILYIYPLWPALYLLARDSFRLSRLSLALSGFLLACSALISTNAVFFTLVIPALLLFKHRKILPAVRGCLYAFAGFLLPVLLCFVYFWRHDALGEWYVWNVVWAQIYAFNRPALIKALKTLLGFLMLWEWIPFALLSFAGVFLIIKRKLYRSDIRAVFACALFAAALLARVILGKEVPRYYLYFLPGMLVALYYGFTLIGRKYRQAFIAVSVPVIVAALCLSGATAYSLRNEWKIETATVEWLTRNTPAYSSLYVWPQGNSLYYLSGRRMATRFFSAGEYLDKAKLWKRNDCTNIEVLWTRFFADLNNEAPDFIVDKSFSFDECNHEARADTHQHYYEVFTNFVAGNYTPVCTISDNRLIYTIYRRNGRELAKINLENPLMTSHQVVTRRNRTPQASRSLDKPVLRRRHA